MFYSSKFAKIHLIHTKIYLHDTFTTTESELFYLGLLYLTWLAYVKRP